MDLIINRKENVALTDIFLTQENHQKVWQLLREYRFVNELKNYGLPVDHKILLHGASGCGKTMLAKAIATALGKPLLVINISTIVQARIGDTAQNLKQIFDRAAREKAVLFLDEFDHIATARQADTNDVGEMRRLVNALIQLVDYFPETALLIAATNHPEIIDHAISRRFQLQMTFTLPSRTLLDTYYNALLTTFPDHLQGIARQYGISFAEAKDHAFAQVKAKLIEELEHLDKSTSSENVDA